MRVKNAKLMDDVIVGQLRIRIATMTSSVSAGRVFCHTYEWRSLRLRWSSGMTCGVWLTFRSSLATATLWKISEGMGPIISPMNVNAITGTAKIKDNHYQDGL